MDRKGEMSMHFEVKVLDFLKPPAEANNVRLCLGLREVRNEAADTDFYYENSLPYDVVQLSMRQFTVPAQQWSIKDGMTYSPPPGGVSVQTIEDSFREFCNQPWSFGLNVEPDIDWVNEEVSLPYDANNRQLNAKFSRKLVG